MTRIKMVAIAILGFAMVVGNADAQDADAQAGPIGGTQATGSKISIGGGALIDASYAGGVNVTADSASVLSLKTPYGGGVFVFLDATYLEASLSFWGGEGKISLTAPMLGDTSSSLKWTRTNLNLGLLFKYPFTIQSNTKISLFPLLGAEYMVALSAVDKDGNDVVDALSMLGQFMGTSSEEYSTTDLSALWIKFGFGMDYKVTEKVAIRGEALYGIRLQNKIETDIIDCQQPMKMSHSLRLVKMSH